MSINESIKGENNSLPSNIRILFGKSVRNSRMSMGISQEELAFRCGLHRTYISDVERGTRNISLENIERIALSLEVPINQLMDFSNI